MKEKILTYLTEITGLSPCDLPLMIYLRPVGFSYNRRDNPNIPSVRQELIQVLDDCFSSGNKGICGAHIHVVESETDELGNPRWSVRQEDYIQFAEFLGARYPDLIIDFDLNPLPQEECEEVFSKLAVDFRSLWPIRFMSDDREESLNLVRDYCGFVQESGKRLFIRLTSLRDLRFVDDVLIKPGILVKPYCFVMSYGFNKRAEEFSAEGFFQLKKHLPKDAFLFVQACGTWAVEATTLAILYGDHVITGLSEVLYLDRAQRIFASNQSLVDQCRRIASALNRDIASPVIARNLLMC